MYRLIESFSVQDIFIFGEKLSVPAIVEDDDGIRLLVLSEPTQDIPISLWTRAFNSGVKALVVVGDPYHGMLTEDYISDRIEVLNAPIYRFPPMATHYFSHPPTYREVRAAALGSPGPIADNFVHLHTHSDYSALDGLSKLSEIVARVKEMGGYAVAVTDHGACAAHPAFYAEATKAGIKPILGIEANVVEDRHARGVPKPEMKTATAAELSSMANSLLAATGVEREDFADWDEKADEERKKAITEAWKKAADVAKNDYFHLILWAMDDEGLKNIWAASTEANRDGYYYRPRMDWDTLRRWNKGVMCSTGCLRGPVAKRLKEGRVEEARINLARLLDIFGDRLYVEIQTNQMEEQKAVNLQLIALAEEMGIPLIAAVDSHYPLEEDAQIHKVWIAIQTDKDLQDESDLFSGDGDYHLMDVDEVRYALSYLPSSIVDQAIANTNLVADRCNVEIKSVSVVPVFGESPQDDVEKLLDACLANWQRKVVGKPHSPEVYRERMVEEMEQIGGKGLAGYFRMVRDYVVWSKSQGILVGPSRGSGGGCLVAYLSDITEMDPVEHDIPFWRFITPGRTELPDFDIDFPQSKRAEIEDYITRRWGEENVIRVGTQVRFKNKGTIRALARVLKSTIDIHFPDIEAINKIITAAEAHTAGKGLSWEELMDQESDTLGPWREKYPLLFECADRVVGGLAHYSRHAAGIVISTDAALTQALPLRRGEEEGDQMISEFDMNVLAQLGFLKFDVLTLRTLDTIQVTVDLIEAQFGERINVYDWRDEYRDPQVWAEVAAGNTLGIFQIETPGMTRLIKKLNPTQLSELSDSITLVRPGPARSGLQDAYLRRKHGEEAVTYPDPRLEGVLASSYGCLTYQEQVMEACMILAGYSTEKADEVRSILGKKKVEKVEEEGRKFIPACVERGMTEADATQLWEQIKEFAKYAFNKAHAFGYAILGWWCAWLKYHWPVQFFGAAMTTIEKDRMPEFIVDARRMGYKVLPPDINESGIGFRTQGMVIRYGLDSVKDVGYISAVDAMAGQPYSSFEDFMARKGNKANAKVVRTLVQVGAFDSIYPNRRALEYLLEWEASPISARCQFWDEAVVGPNALPCRFDWSSEPVVLGVRGQPLKGKPIPQRCSRSCRHYTAPGTPDLSQIGPYSDRDIRQREMEMLGIHLSSTPFDHVPEDLREEVLTAEQLERSPAGQYRTMGLVSRVHVTTDKNGREMAFVDLMAQTANVSFAVFSKAWESYKSDLTPGALLGAVVVKTNRGVNIKSTVRLG